MTIELTPETEAFYRAKVKAGDFATVEAAVTDAIATLAETNYAEQVARINKMIQEGQDAIDRGEYTELNGPEEVNAFFDNLIEECRVEAGLKTPVAA